MSEGTQRIGVQDWNSVWPGFKTGALFLPSLSSDNY